MLVDLVHTKKRNSRRRLVREQVQAFRKTEEHKSDKEKGTKGGSKLESKVSAISAQDCPSGVCAVSWKPKQDNR